MPDTNIIESVRSRVSDAEWQARLDCAACYRLLAAYGMTDLVYNHITVRIPGEGEHLLINPYGWMYEEITASSLITIDIDGNTIFNPHADMGINKAGYVIHSAVHAARADVGCVIHTHTRAGSAVSMMKCGLLPLSQTAMRCLPVAYHSYEGPALNLDEQARLIADLGTASSMILRNHGLLTAAATAAEAFNTLFALEMACQAQVDAMAGNTELNPVSDAVIEASIHQYRPETRRRFGLLEWPAMLRFLDRRDTSWRT